MYLTLLKNRLSGLRSEIFRIVVLVTFIHSTAFAQEDFKPKLGIIDRASLEMTAFPGDSTADAVYLYDYGNVSFSYDDQKGLVMTCEMWARIKILKESALDRASVSLPFYKGNSYQNQELIKDLKGFTYNLENGQIVTTELERKTVKIEKTSDTYYTTKFNLPNVRKGSVIEYSYTVSSPMAVKPEPSTWTFQGSVPFAWSEYNITIPYMFDYKMMMGGYLSAHINKNEQVHVDMGHSRFNQGGIKYRIVVKDAPAFVNEPYITTPSDYISSLKFELSTITIPGETPKRYSETWESVERTLDEVSWFGGELRKGGFLKETINTIAAKTSDPAERMKLAYAHLQQHMKWDGNTGIRSGDGMKKAYDNKKGSVMDINLMLTVMLRSLDLDANPLLLSTREHGRLLEEVPMLESFNYLITHVKAGEKEYLLDATQPFAKPGMLPEHALNESGLLIPEKGKSRFVPIVPVDQQSRLEMINASIIPEEGEIKGNYSISLGGYDALEWREKFASKTDEAILENLKEQVPEWTLENFKVGNKTQDLSAGVSVYSDFEMENENATPGTFYFNPILAGRWTKNPLQSKDRIYPLDLASGISNSFIGNYTLPDGYTLEEIPKTEMMTLPDKAGKFAYQVRQSGNVIQVNSIIQVSKLHFTAEEYHDLKEFFERIIQKHAQPLIIKKQVIQAAK